MENGGTMEQALGILERIAVANESLIALAREERAVVEPEIVFGLPLCPHCQAFNPGVRSVGGDGPMAEFVLVATCQECSEMFIGIPQGWFVFKTLHEAQAHMKGGTE